MHHSPTILALWHAFIRSIGEDPETTLKQFTAWHFCDNEADANELAVLVKKGIKRATASAQWAYEGDEALPQVNDYSVIINWNKEAQCVIRTTAVSVIPFNAVPEEFARVEGEGDGSLEHWRKVHKDCFSRQLKTIGKSFEETMPVVCEEFEVVFDTEEQ